MKTTTGYTVTTRDCGHSTEIAVMTGSRIATATVCHDDGFISVEVDPRHDGDGNPITADDGICDLAALAYYEAAAVRATI
jgi:hypothetical protein